MSKNNYFFQLLPLAALTAIGGQAVMDGVMMRNGSVYGMAVRLPEGRICAMRLPWKSLLTRTWLRRPFLRGFPTLLETVINGIQALNHSCAILEEGREQASGKMGIVTSVLLALFLAVGLFVLAPHLLSLLMHLIGIGGDVNALSFHVWDGFFKCAIFIAYILLIALVPDIRRVFEYHGAEHKTIYAWEIGRMDNAAAMRRLHPRCGTTFILFVILTAILLQSALVPLLLAAMPFTDRLAMHAAGLGIKLALVIPISAVAYELILFAASLENGFAATLLQAPGMALQRLTTREPNAAQLEVAAIALAESLDYADATGIVTASYFRIENKNPGILEQI